VILLRGADRKWVREWRRDPPPPFRLRPSGYGVTRRWDGGGIRSAVATAALWRDRRGAKYSSTSDDWQTKRNLLLTVVKYVKCLDDDGDMELSLVMTKGNKWRREWDLTRSKATKSRSAKRGGNPHKKSHALRRRAKSKRNQKTAGNFICRSRIFYFAVIFMRGYKIGGGRYFRTHGV